MYALLGAIRSILISDQDFTEMVNPDDITTSYKAELVNYPCVTLEIIGGGSGGFTDKITKARVSVTVFSSIGKGQAWAIYERVKTILMSNVNSPGCQIHNCQEISVRDNDYDIAGNAWNVIAEYEFLYSDTSLKITTGATGILYASKSNISPIPANEMARFRGNLSLDIHFESHFRRERYRFSKEVYYHSGMAKLHISKLIFKASIIELLWNVDTIPAGKLNNGITEATTYQVSQRTYPSYIQVLFDLVKTDDGKKLQIEAHKAVCNDIYIPFSREEFVIFDSEWLLLGDSSGNIVRVAVEN